MRTFRCLSCDRPVNFDDGTCPHCGAALGLIPDQAQLVSLTAGDEGTWRVMPPAPWDYHPTVLERLFGARSRVITPEDTGVRYRRCANDLQYGHCNWLIDAASDAAWCPACRTNRTIPNLARPGNLALWGRLEAAKRRALFGLMRLGLNFVDRDTDPDQGLAFDFLSNQDADPGAPVLTGHSNGLITIAIDDLRVPGHRGQAAPPDDLVGLFRHLLAYYYWDRLIRDGGRLEAFRALFGDASLDYAPALQAYRNDGSAADWAERHVSPAASSHPWEDWAETWTLYLRIIDVLETCAQFGLGGSAGLSDGALRPVDPKTTLAAIGGPAALLEHWLPTVTALNDLNRNLGQPDLGPARLAAMAADKLAFVHHTIRSAAGT